MSERPPRPIDSVEDTSSTVPPPEPTPETPKPTEAETEPAATTVEKGPTGEKPPRTEEAFFENFFNKRNRDPREFEEWFRSAEKNIEDTEFDPKEKNKHLKKLKELREIIENLPEASATSRKARMDAERILQYLSNKNMIVLPDVEDATDTVGEGSPDFEELSQEPEVEVVTPEPEMANGPTEPIPTPHTADKAEAEDERTKIYDDPNQDPAVQETESRATRIANERIEAKRAQGSKDADSFDFGMRMHSLANMQAWDTFATLFPQKAAAYKDKIEGLKDALGRKADREEMDARDAAKASKKADPKVGVPPIDQTTGATGSKTSAGSKKKEKATEPPEVFEPLTSTDPNAWEAVLGVSKNATVEDLRDAFRRLSRKYHPDKRNGHPQEKEFEEAFKTVNAAYDAARGKGGRRRYTPPPPSGTTGTTNPGAESGPSTPPPGGTAGEASAGERSESGSSTPPPPGKAAGGAGGGSSTPPPGAGGPTGGPTSSGAPKAPRAARAPKEAKPEGFKGFSEKFESDFNISEKELMTVPGYKDLSFGQRALVHERFQQVLLGKIHEDASGVEQKTGRRTSGTLSKWAAGFMKSYRVAELEKGIAEALSKEGIDAHRSTLEQLVAVTKANGDEVSFDAEGNLDVSYIPGFKAENPKQEKQSERFDEAAARLSQIPAEWSAETATLPQRIKYASARRAYDKARENMLFMKEAQDGDALKAALWMNKIDERVRTDQLLSTHPEAKEELESIKDSALWLKVFQNAGVERAAYFVGGGLSRLLTVSMFGVIAAPAVTGLAGGIKARSRAKEGLRESDTLARRGVKDKGGMAQNMIDVTKNKTAEKLDKLTDEIAKETDHEKRGELIARLRERIKYTQDKLEDGKVSFGAFSERIKNQLDLSQALGRASVASLENPEYAGKTYAEVLSKNVADFMAKKDEAIDKKRSSYLNNAMVKGALISAGFGAAGRVASEFVFHDHLAHGLFDSDGTEATSDVNGGAFGGAGASRHILQPGSGAAGGAHEFTSGHAGKTTEGAVAALEIGKRGPEGSIIDYFKEHQDVAKKFGWDGKGDIKTWAGTKAHALWLEHASKALENDEVKGSLAKLGYTNDLEGYTKMMTRIKSGGVAIDLEHKGVTLSNVEYLNARPTVPVEGIESTASLEPKTIEMMDAARASVSDIETPTDVIEGEPAQQEVDDSQLWKKRGEVLHAPLVEEHAPGMPYDRNPDVSKVGYDGIPFDRDSGVSQIGYEGIPFDRDAGPFLDTSGMNLSQAVVERMNHDLTQVFGTSNEGQSEWPQWRDYGARRFLNLHVDAEQGHAAHLQGYLRDLEARSGLRPRAHILWFNQTVDQYIRKALKVIEQKNQI